MLEIVGLSSTVIMFLIVVIAATVSWGMTQLVRSIIIKHHADAWFMPLIRGVAIIMGGAMGILLVHSVLGLGLGLAAGVLNTTVVAVVKKKIKAVQISGTDDTPPPPPAA